MLPMFRYCRKTLFSLNHNRNLNPTPFYFLQPSLSFISSSEQHSFTLNYLINICGFSPETASKLSNRIRLVNSERPDSVLALFRTHGFSDAEIRRVIDGYPRILTSRSNKTILPKLNFLLSKGASSSDLVHIVTKNPRFLYFGLQNSLTPRYYFIKSFLHSDHSTLLSIKSCPGIIYSKNPSHNVQVLLENGVPESKVAISLRYWPSSLVVFPPIFKNAVEEAKEMEFSPNNTVFIVALRAKLMRKSLWQRKVDLYKKWGWSEEDVISAFVRYPWCMLASEAKIEAMMEYFVNHLGWKSHMLAQQPVLIMMSVEKRLIPRAFVLQFLQSKGLIKDVNLAGAFKVAEKTFLKKYVNCFEKEASQLLKLYEERRDPSR
ncbi:uncharacterized protein LOC113847565 [Abrus precatorius]|uniref:Uncharacterized protein LOC113847565 n=1 Tax=Abrus precatorius TaxID=3816 RepID=A0A8B8JM59_ABRPR|nr:uncharacterized protein LOC113847565 [Abrus precatorius]